MNKNMNISRQSLIDVANLLSKDMMASLEILHKSIDKDCILK